MSDETFHTAESAIAELTKLVSFSREPNIMEAANIPIAENIFAKLKANGIHPSKEEIKQIAMAQGWSTKQADRLARKFGS